MSVVGYQHLHHRIRIHPTSAHDSKDCPISMALAIAESVALGRRWTWHERNQTTTNNRISSQSIVSQDFKMLCDFVGERCVAEWSLITAFEDGKKSRDCKE